MTTMSASLARSRARSVKHFEPNGHFCAPTHSRALTETWQRAAAERVEIACAGGHGRTGTALACLAILDGVPSTEAVAFVREHYDPHAVETPGQRRYVARWRGRQ